MSRPQGVQTAALASSEAYCVFCIIWSFWMIGITTLCSHNACCSDEVLKVVIHLKS